MGYKEVFTPPPVHHCDLPDRLLFTEKDMLGRIIRCDVCGQYYYWGDTTDYYGWLKIDPNSRWDRFWHKDILKNIPNV